MDLESSLSCERLKLLVGCASDSGLKYEVKMASLLYLRAHRLGLRYKLFRNVAAVRPFDDFVLVISVREAQFLILVQLKHAEKRDKVVNLQAFCPKTKENERGDFNLRKYFKVCERLNEVHTEAAESPSDDEKILCKTPLDRTWYLLFTNKVVNCWTADDDQEPEGQISTYEKEENEKEKEGTCSDTTQLENVNMLEELFNTSSQRKSLCFKKSHSEVWNQFDNDHRQILYRTKFLPRLRIFHTQAHVDDLNELILQEIDEIFGKPVPFEFANHILQNLLQEAHAWMSEPEGRALTETSRLLERATGAETRRLARELVVSSNYAALRFQDAYCTALAMKLRHRKHLCIHVIGGPPGLRAAKIVQVLDSSPKSCNSWTYLNDGIFHLLSPKAIKMLTSTTDIVVMDMDLSCNRHVLKTIYCDSNQNQYVIFVPTHEEDLPMLCADKLTENWVLEQLSKDFQEALLQRVVNFQGVDVSLRSLEANWPSLRQSVSGASLCDLVGGRPLLLGAALPPLQSYFIPRTVQHRSALHASVLEVRTDRDCFVLKGFTEDILGRLRSPDSQWEECFSSWEPKLMLENALESLQISDLIKTRWVECRSNSEEVRANNSKNTHWLVNNGGHIIWEKSDGETRILEKYLLRSNERCQVLPWCNHNDINDFVHWRVHNVLLADVAGMGKSTFITHLAHAIKKIHKTYWVIVLRINDGKVLDHLPSDVNELHVMDIIFNSVSVKDRKENRTMIRKFLTDTFGQSSCIVVMVDGVDEVCPAHKKKVIRVLELLREALERSGGRLWVASRTVLEEDLSITLRSEASLSLRPFSRDDQIRFLLHRWEHYLHGIHSEEQNRLVGTLLDAVQEVAASHGSNICDVPLYTQMLSNAFEEKELVQLLKEVNTNTLMRFSRFALYKKFVTTTLNIMWEKDGIFESVRDNLNITSNTLETHKIFAVLECFDKHKILRTSAAIPRVKTITDSSQIERLVRNGIITKFVDGKPTFLHYTIAEFFAGCWLSKYFSSLRPLLKDLYAGMFGECRYFFDASLAEGWPPHEAALAGHSDSLEALLRNGRDANEQCSGGRTALHFAAIAGNAAAIIRLLEAGADPSLKDKVLQWTALRYADCMLHNRSEGLKKESHLEVVEILLKSGGRSRDIPGVLHGKFMDSIIEKDFVCTAHKIMKKKYPAYSKVSFLNRRSGNKYAFKAAENGSVKILNMLINKGFSKDKWLGDKQRTLLQSAACNGRDQMCRFLIQRGVNVNQRNENGSTALMLAAQKGHESTCRLLLDNGAGCDGSSDFCKLALLFASKYGHVNICRLLLERSDNFMPGDIMLRTSLEAAALYGHENVCRLLLQSGVNSFPINDITQNALTKAAYYGKEPLCRLMLENFVSSDIKDHSQFRALHYAALGGHINICHFLLDYGIDVNGIDGFCNTALHLAARKPREDICSVLLEHGVTVNARNKEGATALHNAAREGHVNVCKLLVSHHADVNAQSETGTLALHHAASRGHESVCSYLLNAGTNINATDEFGFTALIYAVQQGHEEVCKILLQNGVDINTRDAKGLTALHHAACKGNINICVLLLGAGIDINSKNTNGETALMYAVQNNHEQLSKLLVINGSEINEENKQGLTALHYAVRNGNELICNFLLENGAFSSSSTKFTQQI